MQEAEINVSDESVEKDALYTQLKRCGLPVSGDHITMKQLLKEGTLLRALNRVKLESIEKADLLRTRDLSTQEGINSLIKIQGEASGLLRAIDIMIDAAFSETN